MITALLILFGFILALCVVDVALSFRIYHQFPSQSKRWWPGAGFWTCWKMAIVLRSARHRLNAIHQAAVLFPMTTGHNNVTREFVDVVRSTSDLTRKGGVK